MVFKDPVGINGLLRSGLFTGSDTQVQQLDRETPLFSQPQQGLSRPVDVSIEHSPVPEAGGNQEPTAYRFQHSPAQIPTPVTESAISPCDVPSHQHPQRLPAIFHDHDHPKILEGSPSSEEVSEPYSVPSRDRTRNIQKQQFYHLHIQPENASQTAFVDRYGNEYSRIDPTQESVDEEYEGELDRQRSIMPYPNHDERRLQSLSTHLDEPNILASYRPTFGSSPLDNPETARAFAHFVHSVGPSLSVFERHPVDVPNILGGHVPAAQQGLWTYTLALKALEHQALLQAMLAVSSLHISFLQHAPQTVSLKHYHYALRRVGSAVGLPTRRQQYGTLAATLLLGYYEVTAADHFKWNSHVAGSGQLVREIDYAGVTRDLRAYRRRLRVQREQMARSSPLFADSLSGESGEDPFEEKESSIDSDLIGTIMGRPVNYDECGRVEDGPARPYQRHFTWKDIEDFRVQCDLYWWYCKQDTFQSILSGNKPLSVTPFILNCLGR